MGLALASCFACTACNAACTLAATVCSCAGCLCSGGGGSSDTPRDLMVGKLRSMGVVMASIVLGLLTQYLWADDLAEKLSAWADSCDGNTTCIGNSAILRVSMVDAVFFVFMMCGACGSSLFNNRYWGIKLGFWAAMITGSVFIDNDVFIGYAWPARFGAYLFIILQQVVLIDMAYRWNDAWVERAEELGTDGAGRKLLVFLVAASAILFLGSIAAIGVLYGYFSGCASNEVIISLTLVLCVLMTGAQLLGSEGNLLTSAVVCAYAVFLAFSAVGKNPDSECNPFVGHSQNVTSIILGLILTVLSLLWICAGAATSITKMLGGDTPPTTVESVANVQAAKAQGGSPNTGTPFVPPASNTISGMEREGIAVAGQQEDPEDHGDGWKFNVVMVLLSMFFGMMLTNWGVVQSDRGSTDTGSDSYSDPKNGIAAMWLTAAGQWTCMLLYIWTLVAPKLFPNRDFS